MGNDTATQASADALALKTREKLSMVMVSVTLVVVAMLSITAVAAAWHDLTARLDTVKYVFGSVLPMLGTWIGTVVAFYFTRENFQVASQETRKLLEATIGERLRAVKVRDAMLPRSQVMVCRTRWTKDPDIKIIELLEMMAGAVTRAPIVDPQYLIKYIVHQGTLATYVAQLARDAATANRICDLSTQDLGHLLALPGMREKVAEGIAYVGIDASLADAKEQMERKGPNCQDVIVTATGRADEPLLGWLTNVEISKRSSA